ncbi:hypothetical protein [Mobilicoccus caccae]|uniref:Uncharacterized protein n=1 Tax=Mobilicoccus caccae TaxID=1859295 RepID=A0ABQ6IUQ4_9MICO|nr:hypothetical protein [Mobilicoccus caccae]GMA41023.1 hypothetical protein GCM10025883_30680 [Mobilicoccus caccae]
MSRTITLATWEQVTGGLRDTNPFDFIEHQLVPHCTRVGLYDIVRSYSDQVAEALPGHIDFVDNAFIASSDAVTDPEGVRAVILAAINEADDRHRRLVESWLA